MKILAIDTASNICGVSIMNDTDLLIKLDTDTGRTHSENLMPMIKTALDKTNLSLSDINLIVCDKGPGSFTGIRIGLATANAFCDSLNIPSIGISSLEALSYQVKEDGFIASILDCKNNNCYFALYKLNNLKYETIIEPKACTINEVIQELEIYKDDSIYFIGDATPLYIDLLENNFSNSKFANENKLDFYFLGLAGLDKYKENKNIIKKELLPLYLKKPQAQRQLEEKLKNESFN